MNNRHRRVKKVKEDHTIKIWHKRREGAVINIRQFLCNHQWAVDHEYDVYRNLMHEWRVCIKCGKEDGK